MTDRLCKLCGKELKGRQKNFNVFCSRLCAVEFRNREKIRKWLESGNIPYKNNTMIAVNSVYRRYILEEQQHRCAICGIGEMWEDKKLVFILDHIDGNASNHRRDNLRLVCPNCDSQLPTYKARNKKSTRTYRKYCP